MSNSGAKGLMKKSSEPNALALQLGFNMTVAVTEAGWLFPRENLGVCLTPRLICAEQHCQAPPLPPPTYPENIVIVLTCHGCRSVSYVTSVYKDDEQFT